MKKLNYFLTLIILIAPLFLQGQADTVYIETIEIRAKKIREQSIGGQIIHWNKEDLNNTNTDNVAELLESEAGVFIKSYGQNSLATSSIRGGNAGHTLVLWNGLPIQSPMLGLLDLSLLPLNGVEKISLEKGGNTALWGGGAIGGVVALDNQANFSNKLSQNVQVTIGSFGELASQFNLGFGNKKFQSSTKLFSHQAENDFSYFIAPGFPRREQTNAHFLQRNLLQDLYWKLKPNQILSFHYWKQTSDREIPPTNVQDFSKTHQDDESDRFLLDWRFLGEHVIIQAKVGHFKEWQIYYDDASGLEANNRFTTSMAELDGQWHWKNKHRLYLGATQTFTKAQSVNYVEPPIENKSALFASYQFNQPKYQIQASLRQGLVDGHFIPFVPVLGFNLQLFEPFHLKGKISRNYRLPTLNDRYWNPGGKEDILPESGWSQELSLLTDFEFGKSRFELSSTGFNRNIKNWILWSRLEGQAFWSANNITEVWSRGLEQRFSYTFQHNELQLKLNLGYDFIRSTNQVALALPKIAAGAQLIYTPKHKIFSSINLRWKNLKAIYKHQYTESSQGLNDVVDAYNVGNLRLQYDLKQRTSTGRLFLNINNIWNTNYFIIERRPMPGTNFQFGINFLFN